VSLGTVRGLGGIMRGLPGVLGGVLGRVILRYLADSAAVVAVLATHRVLVLGHLGDGLAVRVGCRIDRLLDNRLFRDGLFRDGRGLAHHGLRGVLGGLHGVLGRFGLGDRADVATVVAVCAAGATSLRGF
jgi:hypothetical protein